MRNITAYQWRKTHDTNPTEETLKQMRQSDPPVSYLVGTPRGRLTTLEKAFLGKPWEQARKSVSVKLLAQEGELYILAKSEGRLHKERAIRRRKLNTSGNAYTNCNSRN